MNNTAPHPSTDDMTPSDAISAGMDNELDNPAIRQLLQQCKQDTVSSAQWRTYHIISDTLRQMPLTSNQLAENIRRQLADEPTLLAPQRQRGFGKKYVMPIAASVTAIWLVSWSALNVPTTSPHPAVIATAVAPQQQLAKIDQTKLNNFIAAHRDFSPGASSPFMDATYQVPAEPAR